MLRCAVLALFAGAAVAVRAHGGWQRHGALGELHTCVYTNCTLLLYEQQRKVTIGALQLVISSKEEREGTI